MLRNLFILVLTLCHISNCYAQINIVSTTSPIASLIKTIGGEYVHISILQKQQGCPHHYQITPTNLQELQDADLIVAINDSFETYLDVIHRRLPNKKIIYVSNFQNLNLKPLSSKSYNWHLWLDLGNSAQILQHFTKLMSDAIPKQQAYFESNFETAISQIKALQARQNQIYHKLPQSFIWSNDLVYLYTPNLPHIEFTGLRSDSYQLISFAKNNIAPKTCILSTKAHYQRQISKIIPEHTKFAIINGDNWKVPKDKTELRDMYFNQLHQILSAIATQCLNSVVD